MIKMPALEAKQNFGRMIDTAQREPITIEKHGRPVAVVMSAHEYEHIQDLKLEQVRQKIDKGVKQIKEGDTVDGEIFFKELLEENS